MSTPLSIQERLQLKRDPVDQWSIREKLCLASAVVNSGDQNWMSVSRSLKMVCNAKRPDDWFNQKPCAAQYGKLLETVETPKRKKRTASERDSSTPVETSNESIVRRLTQERINELKKIMLEEQQQFQKLKEEILLIQSGQATEAQLREMWNSIEEENRQKEVDKKNHDEWLKRREQRKLEMERAWRPGPAAYKQKVAAAAAAAAAALPVKPKEEEQEDVTTQRSSSGQSPLLTSLLKSPSSTVAGAISTTPTTPTTSKVGGPTQLNLAASFDAAFQQVTSIPDSSVKSASQQAPTLSMLLDQKAGPSRTPVKSHMETTSDDNSIDITADIFPEQIPSIESGDGGDVKDDDQLMEVFKGLIPEDIDELANILTDNPAIIPELLGEEEILDKVGAMISKAEEAQEEEEEEVEEVPKMDTFDQLKNESILEERKKREAAAVKAAVLEEEAKNAVTTSEDSRSMNVSPEDSNQEDDIPLRVIQQDIMEANKSKEEEVPPNLEEDRETPMSEEPLFPEKPEVITDETSSTDPSGVEVKQEPEETEHEVFEAQKSEEEVKKESEADTEKPSDEEVFEDAKEDLKEELAGPTDTDEDSVVASKDLETSKTRSGSRRDLSFRRRTAEEVMQIKSEDSDSRSSSLLARTRSKDHDRSESPLDDDSADNTPRRTRRFSSTPVIDSVPNSPVPSSSVEDKEQKAWRKQIMIALGRITSHKNAADFNQVSKEEQERRFKGVVLRPMDMTTIKRSIESGCIKTTSEFQRDVMLFFTNIMMTSRLKSSTYAQAREMMQESIAIIKTTMEGFKQEKEAPPVTPTEKPSTPVTSSGVKRGSRKSQRVP